MESLFSLPMTVQAALATLMTCLLTSLGALTVFCFNRRHTTLLNAMLAAGAGVMLASSFWSLLSPGLSMAQELGQNPWAVVCGGFLTGGALLMAGERLFERFRRRAMDSGSADRRRRMLMTSITLHNIPEGLAVGVAFGATLGQPALYQGAWMLALGIGLQNVPEGAAVSLPLHRDGMSKPRACFYGFLSGLVEPVAGVLGALLAASARNIMPFMLSFAAGAMILVVVEELIPESQRARHPELMTLATLLGFAVMMALDVALG